MSIAKTTPPKKAPARVRRSPEASRDNILIAAERLLVRTGPQSLRLADVAKEAGVANATVLHHFATIDGVQAALMEKMIANTQKRQTKKGDNSKAETAKAPAEQSLTPTLPTPPGTTVTDTTTPAPPASQDKSGSAEVLK